MRIILDNTEVFPEVADNQKVCRENPMISSSGDYTMEIVLPLSVLQNREFFGPWQRVEVTKNTRVYSAQLIVENRVIINGSAKVTNVTQDAVKIQLYGNRSEFNAVYGDLYIDELDLPWCKAGFWVKGEISHSGGRR